MPITNASSELSDFEALTSKHLLLLKVKPELPPGVFNKVRLQKMETSPVPRWCLLETLVQRIPHTAPTASAMVHTMKKFLYR